jgi:predicted nucleic acid-binding protein
MAREATPTTSACDRRPGLNLRSGQGTAALILYFDTSALIKLVLPEEGSALALELWNGDFRAAASALVYPEGRAALAAAERSKRLAGRRHREAVKNFDRAYEEIATIGVDEQLAVEAGAMASEFSLRGYDAVHLATALRLAHRDVALVSWDQDLCRAGVEAGLVVVGE